VKRVVFLSSIGAHLEANSGIIQRYNEIESVLNQLGHVSITFMRPTSFFYNLLAYIPVIKSQGIIAANYGADGLIPWVSPNDIAAAIAEEITTAHEGKKVRYVGSEELTGDETARILGEAIRKPDLKWVLISDEETLNGLVNVGIQPKIAEGLVEMYAGLYNGLLEKTITVTDLPKWEKQNWPIMPKNLLQFSTRNKYLRLWQTINRIKLKP